MSNQSSNSNNSKFGLYDIVVIGLMAAVCFVTTYFLRIEIPTPAGPTNIKIGNVFCLLAGLLFGGWRGGLDKINRTDGQADRVQITEKLLNEGNFL